MAAEKQVAFIGCALDPDERQEAIAAKLSALGMGADPYERVMAYIRNEVDPARWREAGCIQTPDWLLPSPPPQAAGEITVEGMVRFIDSGGCRQYADKVQEAAEALLPELPCLLAVDHCLSGGMIAALAAAHGPENVSVIVADAHNDAVPMSAMAGAIAYDMEINPNSLFDPADPFLRGRPESFNASSFLHHLLAEGVLLPQNLYLLGIADYPPKKALRLKDPRMKAYTGAWTSLKRRGVGLATSRDLASGSAKLRALLGRIKTPYLYVSLDLDVGAGAALSGVRFRDRAGLSEPRLYALARALQDVLSRGVELAGLDLCEFDARTAGNDRTYRIAANLIEMLAFGQEPRD
jgi:arginase family enzyme